MTARPPLAVLIRAATSRVLEFRTVAGPVLGFVRHPPLEAIARQLFARSWATSLPEGVDVGVSAWTRNAGGALTRYGRRLRIGTYDICGGRAE